MALDLDQGGRIPQNVSTYLGPTLGWRYTDAPTDIEFVMSGGGVTVAPGFKGVLTIPEWVVVQSWVLLADRACTATVDIWRNEITITSSYGAAPEDLVGAIKLIESGKIDVKSMITHRLPLEQAQEGFRLVTDAKQTLKVVLLP